MASEPDHMQLAFEAGRVFSPAAPVDERALFAGRRDQLRAVFDAISRRGQHAIIFGERGVGKTSLGNVLSDILPDYADRVLVVRINCDTSDDYASVWRKAFSEIKLRRNVPGMGFLADETTISDDLAASLPARVTPDDVRGRLAMLGQHLPAIIIIDEFDRIKTKDSTAWFSDTIKTLSDHSVQVTLIIVGVADSVDDLIDEHESIERALVQVPMLRMSDPELREIVINGLSRLSMTINDEALEQISLLSQGLPHYTHLLGLHSTRQALDEGLKHVEVAHVVTAIGKALAEAQQSIRNAYNRATTSPRRESLYAQVLLACALAKTDELGYFPAAALREPMSKIMGKPYDIPSFSRHLKEFTEPSRGEILQRMGPDRRLRYRFMNPLLQPYVTMRGVADALISREMLEELRSE